MRTVAALFVDPRGCYAGQPGVDAWDESRDARLYAGEHPVIAHPPCERWGKYYQGPGTPADQRRRRGDDGGCFAAALRAVRRWGGVLEHPALSSAWSWFSLRAPPPSGWGPAGRGEWVCRVEQGHYGHLARKPTWLYVSGVPHERLPVLVEGPSVMRKTIEMMGKRERQATPPAFRDLLLSIARSVP